MPQNRLKLKNEMNNKLVYTLIKKAVGVVPGSKAWVGRNNAAPSFTKLIKNTNPSNTAKAKRNRMSADPAKTFQELRDLRKKIEDRRTSPYNRYLKQWEYDNRTKYDKPFEGYDPKDETINTAYDTNYYQPSRRDWREDTYHNYVLKLQELTNRYRNPEAGTPRMSFPELRQNIANAARDLELELEYGDLMQRGTEAYKHGIAQSVPNIRYTAAMETLPVMITANLPEANAMAGPVVSQLDRYTSGIHQNVKAVGNNANTINNRMNKTISINLGFAPPTIGPASALPPTTTPAIVGHEIGGHIASAYHPDGGKYMGNAPGAANPKENAGVESLGANPKYKKVEEEYFESPNNKLIEELTADNLAIANAVSRYSTIPSFPALKQQMQTTYPLQYATYSGKAIKPEKLEASLAGLGERPRMPESINDVHLPSDKVKQIMDETYAAQKAWDDAERKAVEDFERMHGNFEQGFAEAGFGPAAQAQSVPIWKDIIRFEKNRGYVPNPDIHGLVNPSHVESAKNKVKRISERYGLDENNADVESLLSTGALTNSALKNVPLPSTNDMTMGEAIQLVNNPEGKKLLSRIKEYVNATDDMAVADILDMAKARMDAKKVHGASMLRETTSDFGPKLEEIRKLLPEDIVKSMLISKRTSGPMRGPTTREILRGLGFNKRQINQIIEEIRTNRETKGRAIHELMNTHGTPEAQAELAERTKRLVEAYGDFPENNRFDFNTATQPGGPVLYEDSAYTLGDPMQLYEKALEIQRQKGYNI